METTVPNLYACGDCTGGILQISKATYEGTKVGLEIVNKLKNKNNKKNLLHALFIRNQKTLAVINKGD